MFDVFFSGFAQIQEDIIPDGIMFRRQAAATGVTSTTSSIEGTTTTTPTDTPTTSETTPIVSTPTSGTSTPTTASSSPTPDTSTPTTASASPTSTPTTASQTDPTPSSSSSSAAAPQSSTTDQSAQETTIRASASSIPTIIDVTTTNADGSTITTRIATTTLAIPKATSSNIASTGTGTRSNFVIIGGSTIDRSTLSSATVITRPLVAQETIRSTYTSYWTSDGTVSSSVVTTDRVIETTTGSATATISPLLQDSGSGGSALTGTSKKIIGGVVGGIGGAIFIGGIALVAWRVWGKKRRQGAAKDEFGSEREDSIRREKRVSEGQPLNQASNF